MHRRLLDVITNRNRKGEVRYPGRARTAVENEQCRSRKGDFCRVVQNLSLREEETPLPRTVMGIKEM